MVVILAPVTEDAGEEEDDAAVLALSTLTLDGDAFADAALPPSIQSVPHMTQ